MSNSLLRSFHAPLGQRWVRSLTHRSSKPTKDCDNTSASWDIMTLEKFPQTSEGRRYDFAWDGLRGPEESTTGMGFLGGPVRCNVTLY